MGIYDRDYYQENKASRNWGSSSRSMVTTLILVNAAVAILDVFSPMDPNDGGHWLGNALALHADSIWKPWRYWEFLTAGFTHVSLDASVWHLAMNMYGLWLFGRGVEGIYGAGLFLRIYLMLIVGASIIWAVAQELSGVRGTMIGASGAVSGITILFVLHYPHEKVLLFPIPVPIPMWIVGTLLIGLDAIGAAGFSTPGGPGVAYSAHLGGALLGWLFYRGWIPLKGPGTWSRLRLPRSRPRLKIVRDDETAEGDLERRADEILAKVHAQGADSLTPEERRILNDFSRRMRQKLR